MFLVFASLASVMTVIGRIRVVAGRWVWRFSFPILTMFLFFVLLFFFALESHYNVSDESDDDGSGSGFISSLCVSSCFELYLDLVSRLLSSWVTIFIGGVRWIFSGLGVYRSKASLVSIPKFLIWLRNLDFITATRAKNLNGLRKGT